RRGGGGRDGSGALRAAGGGFRRRPARSPLPGELEQDLDPGAGEAEDDCEVEAGSERALHGEARRERGARRNARRSSSLDTPIAGTARVSTGMRVSGKTVTQTAAIPVGPQWLPTTKEIGIRTEMTTAICSR